MELKQQGMACMLNRVGILVAALVVSGCSIKQTVDAPDLNPQLAPEICLIPAKGVRQGFTDVYTANLESKGFKVHMLRAGASPSRCPLSTTYIGTWNWDAALYMEFADIRIYENGRKVGQAIYDSRSGSGRLDKFIDAENKINELVDQLFPNGASGLGKAPVASARPSSADISKEQQMQELMNDNTLGYEEYMRRVKVLQAQ